MADDATTNKRKRDSPSHSSPSLSRFFRRLSGRTSPKMSFDLSEDDPFRSAKSGEDGPGPAIENKDTTDQTLLPATKYSPPKNDDDAAEPSQSEEMRLAKAGKRRELDAESAIEDDDYEPTLLKPLTFEIPKANKPSRYANSDDSPGFRQNLNKLFKRDKAEKEFQPTEEQKRVREESERIRAELEAAGIHVRDFATGYETGK